MLKWFVSSRQSSIFGLHLLGFGLNLNVKMY